MNLNDYKISKNSSVINALEKLDKSSSQTIFVVDEQDIVIGSITDGDFRRGFIKGLNLDDSLNKFMFESFSFLKENEENYSKLKSFRNKKLKVVPYLSQEGRLLKIYDFTKTKSILPIDAVIMAGGLGSRLRPLTNDIPKPLLKIGNKEIISYNFDRLHQYGIINQFVTVNYLANQIEDFCNDYNKDINFKIVKEEEFLGTAGALSLIDNFKNDTVLLMNSDLLTNIDYEDFYKSFLKHNADIMVASVPYEVNLPYAIFNSDNKRVTGFKEKPSYTYYANAGIYLIKKNLIENIPKKTFYNATDLMDKVIETNKNLIHYPITSYWLDIGKHKDYEKAQRDIAHINW